MSKCSWWEEGVGEEDEEAEAGSHLPLVLLEAHHHQPAQRAHAHHHTLLQIGSPWHWILKLVWNTKVDQISPPILQHFM